MERAPLRPVPSSPPGPVDPAEAIRHVTAELSVLDGPAAEVFALVALAGRSRAEVAGYAGLAGDELGAALARARKELRRRLHPLPGTGWCERAERLISDRIDGALEDPGPRRLDVHLANCARCVEHERRLGQAHDALVKGFVAATAPPAQEPAVEPEARAEPETEPEEPAPAPAAALRIVDTSTAAGAAAADPVAPDEPATPAAPPDLPALGADMPTALPEAEDAPALPEPEEQPILPEREGTAELAEPEEAPALAEADGPAELVEGPDTPELAEGGEPAPLGAVEPPALAEPDEPVGSAETDDPPALAEPIPSPSGKQTPPEPPAAGEPEEPPSRSDSEDDAPLGALLQMPVTRPRSPEPAAAPRPSAPAHRPFAPATAPVRLPRPASAPSPERERLAAIYAPVKPQAGSRPLAEDETWTAIGPLLAIFGVAVLMLVFGVLAVAL